MKEAFVYVIVREEARDGLEFSERVTDTDIRDEYEPSILVVVVLLEVVVLLVVLEGVSVPDCVDVFEIRARVAFELLVEEDVLRIVELRVFVPTLLLVNELELVDVFVCVRDPVVVGDEEEVLERAREDVPIKEVTPDLVCAAERVKEAEELEVFEGAEERV